MKKVVAALVALAMILAMAPAVFAVTESGGFMLEGGTPYEWTAEYTGTATLYGEPSVNIMVDNGNLGMGPNPSFEVTEGTTYTVQHFGSGFAWISWDIEVAGGNQGGDSAASGALNIEAYGNTDWTAPQDGTVQFTINIPGASLVVLHGYAPLAEGTDSVTAQVTAGTTYLVAPGFDVMTDSVITWEYVAGGNQGGGAVETIPSGGALALGDNNVSLSYATMPMMAPQWNYTATEGGYLTVTVSSINGNSMLGMPFGMGMYTLLVGNTDGQYTNTATVYVNANESVNIAVLDTMDMQPVPAVLNLTFGVPVVEESPADYFNQDSDGNYIIESIADPVGIFSGNNDINYIYTAESAGTLTLTATVDGYEGTYCAIKVNDGEWAFSPTSVAVEAGDVVLINVWGGYEGTVELSAGGNQGGNQGGGAVETIPSGGALALGDNNVSLSYAQVPAQAPQWTYTATESGYLTVTVSSINGNSMLDRPFGMGMYTLLVGNTDGQYTNTATVYVNANEPVNIAVWDTMDMEPVPAVLNLAFVPGAPIVEETPADYFNQDSDGNYIIESIADPVGIFSGNNDINYIYTAEAAGTLTLTATVDGYEGTNCAIKVNNGGWAYSATSATVETGDVVLINVWNGYEGVVGLTAGGGNGGDESDSMSGENVAVGADESLEIFYIPTTNGTLTVDISANPGFRVEVQNAVTMDTIGLPKESTLAQAVTYELEAGVEYKITLNGFSAATWGPADATITYNITFEEGVSSETVDIEKSETILDLGANTVDLLENTIVSLYEFTPAEPGIYTITVTGDVTMATYGYAAWNKLADAENGVIVHTATDAEQTILIGLTADAASVTVTIEKTGNYTPPAQNEYADYEPSCPVISDFEDPSDLVSIDINKEQNVVLGDDGYYHLGTADGPIVYVNLNNVQFTLAVLYDAGAPITMRGAYVDENGETHYYDFMDMITGNYYEYSKENDYHPLNKDLKIFLKAYGESQGWYNANTSAFETIQNGEFLEESAWLACCYSTVSSVQPGGSNVPDTGDVGFIGAAVAMTISAICGTALVVKKKEF